MEKVAVIVWALDPDGAIRFLLRHNRPFGGYTDEWTIIFGGVEEGEDAPSAASREAYEELGVSGELTDLKYTIEYPENNTMVVIGFYSLKLNCIDERIILNAESIGYDWMLRDAATSIMKHADESRALDLIH